MILQIHIKTDIYYLWPKLFFTMSWQMWQWCCNSDWIDFSAVRGKVLNCANKKNPAVKKNIGEWIQLLGVAQVQLTARWRSNSDWIDFSTEGNYCWWVVLYDIHIYSFNEQTDKTAWSIKNSLSLNCKFFLSRFERLPPAQSH